MTWPRASGSRTWEAATSSSSPSAEVEVAARGADAQDAVATITGLIEGGFGEV
ncbi:MAG: HPr family phosphocarrier protein [Actinomycetes bacterium]